MQESRDSLRRETEDNSIARRHQLPRLLADLVAEFRLHLIEGDLAAMAHHADEHRGHQRREHAGEQTHQPRAIERLRVHRVLALDRLVVHERAGHEGQGLGDDQHENDACAEFGHGCVRGRFGARTSCVLSSVCGWQFVLVARASCPGRHSNGQDACSTTRDSTTRDSTTRHARIHLRRPITI